MLIKILYWGTHGCGKTTIVDTFYRLTKEQNMEFEPTTELTKINREGGATLYFDRGIFKNKTQTEDLYHVYTVAGQSSFSQLRTRVFQGTQGVILVVDSQARLFEDNIEALKELKNVARGNLIKKIPLIVMLNKQDLPNVITVEDFQVILKENKLWFDPGEKLSVWNPIIYETCALYNQEMNIYRSFSECARRTMLYLNLGKGEAPLDTTS